jgi:hypothetical protein
MLAKTRSKIWWGVAISLGVVLIGLPALFIWNLRRVHQHCIKCSGMILRTYATDHGGKYPVHTNGFGDALALLVAEDPDPNSALFLLG